MAVVASVLDILKDLVAVLANENTFFIIERVILMNRKVWVLRRGYIGILREVSEKSPPDGDYLGVFNKVSRIYNGIRRYETINAITCFSHVGYVSVEERHRVIQT